MPSSHLILCRPLLLLPSVFPILVLSSISLHWNCDVEKTLESALDCKEIQPVHPKGDQS